MTTPRDIIQLALKSSGVLGVGQTALAEDINDGFAFLNQMIAQWAQKRWLVYALSTYSTVSTGAQTYTVGPGGVFDISPRPDRIESAYFRQLVQSTPNQVDYPLRLISARETYNRISIKMLTSFPSVFFYESAYPLGLFYPYPLAQASSYSLFISVKTVISQFTSLSQTIVLPPEYEAAMHYNLAIRLAAAYQIAPREDVRALAKDALAVLRGSNTQLALLQMPNSLVRPGLYNPYSDQTY
jgi:hypothetical protein